MKKLVYCLAASSLLFIGCQKETEIQPLSAETQTTANEIPAEVTSILNKPAIAMLKNESGPYSQSMSNLAECVIAGDEETANVTETYSEAPFSSVYASELKVGKRYYGGRSGDDCFLIMQKDGNLVLYSRSASGALTARWSSHTWGNAGARCFMQNDGNLVVYSKAWKAIWCSKTWNPNKELALYVTEQGVSIREKAKLITHVLYSGAAISYVQDIDDCTIFWKKYYR